MDKQVRWAFLPSQEGLQEGNTCGNQDERWELKECPLVCSCGLVRKEEDAASWRTLGRIRSCSWQHNHGIRAASFFRTRRALSVRRKRNERLSCLLLSSAPSLNKVGGTSREEEVSFLMNCQRPVACFNWLHLNYILLTQTPHFTFRTQQIPISKHTIKKCQ